MTFANVLEALGGLAVVAGLWLLAPWAALVAGGLMLVAAAWAIEGAGE